MGSARERALCKGAIFHYSCLFRGWYTVHSLSSCLTHMATRRQSTGGLTPTRLGSIVSVCLSIADSRRTTKKSPSSLERVLASVVISPTLLPPVCDRLSQGLHHIATTWASGWSWGGPVSHRLQLLQATLEVQRRVPPCRRRWHRWSRLAVQGQWWRCEQRRWRWWRRWRGDCCWQGSRRWLGSRCR